MDYVVLITLVFDLVVIFLVRLLFPAVFASLLDTAWGVVTVWVSVIKFCLVPVVKLLRPSWKAWRAFRVVSLAVSLAVCVLGALVVAKPGWFTARLSVTVLSLECADRGREKVGGYVTLIVDRDSALRPVYPESPARFVGIKSAVKYTLLFRPFEHETKTLSTSAIDGRETPRIGEEILDTIFTSPILYGGWVSSEPIDARLEISKEGRFITQDRSVKLSSGKFEYSLQKKGYIPLRGTFWIPEDIHDGVITLTSQARCQHVLRVTLMGNTSLGDLRETRIEIWKEHSIVFAGENKASFSVEEGSYTIRGRAKLRTPDGVFECEATKSVRIDRDLDQTLILPCK